jgi:hypothetical protein
VAAVIVNKYAWHKPLYRQAQIMALQGLPVDRSTLAGWVGVAAAELKPVYLRMKELLLGSAKIVVDETRAPVLDPGRGRTKTGYFWAISRDDRPWGGPDPPAVARRDGVASMRRPCLRAIAGSSVRRLRSLQAVLRPSRLRLPGDFGILLVALATEVRGDRPGWAGTDRP